jgi:hypothetical protein
MSLLDDLINKIDQSIDLYGILKGMDNAFGEDIRRELLYELEYWSSPEALDVIVNMLKNPAKADWEFIKKLIERELKGRPVADGTIPPWEKDKEQKEKPVIKSDPPPFKDNVITPRPAPGGGGKGLPPQRPVKRLPPRKLLPPITNPGFTTTEVTKPITAKAQIGNKQWGELVCYCLAEKGVTVVNPTLDPSTTNSNAAKALESLYGIIYADALPVSLPVKQAVKSKASWWAGSAWAAPSNIQGLTGDVSLIGGVDAIYDIAQAMAIASFNAYVGFQAELYIETETIENPGTIGTRSYADLPFLAGQNNMFYELGTLKDMDMGVFMGIPYDQWLKATPKTGNLQLLFYGKKKPPYSFKGPDGKTARYRPSEVNIPDPRELTWAEIKSVASQYTTGGHCCTIQLECGRPIVAWANSDSAAEDRARSLATLSTSPVTDKDPVFTIIKSKKTLTMYPGEAIYTVGGSSGKQKMKLWVEKVEDSGYDDALLKEEDLSTLT